MRRWRGPDTVGGVNTELVPESGPGRGVRLFVGCFLGLFLVGGLIGVEAWPLTGWKLYARLRHGEFSGWQVLAVGYDGNERVVDLRHAPAAFHGVNHFLNDVDGLTDEQREAACLGLVEAARRQYPDVAGVAIDHIVGYVLVHPGDPPRPPSQRIRIHQCSAG